MQKFWTVTDANTSHTNSRSSRFSSVEDAIHEAAVRIESARSEAVFILECVKVVKRAKLPVSVEDVTELPRVTAPLPRDEPPFDEE